MSHGYFPTELPPPFTTQGFAAQASVLVRAWSEQKILAFWSAAEAYSIPRYGHARRKLSLVNPVNQLLVAKLVADHWHDIRTRLQRSNITEFDPRIVLRGSGRAVTGVDFDAVSRRRTTILANFGRYVKTDITRFYPSVYTHSIAWSLLGRDWCKTNQGQSAFKQSFANRLDAAIRAGQLGQSVGIPIGPDTSRIISELIATEIEQTMTANIPDLSRRAVRYVDDMLVGLRAEETPAGVLSNISASLYDYELEINAEKTATFGIGHPHSPEWIHYIRVFEPSERPTRQREDIDSFFEQALNLADSNARDNVMLFAVKRAAGFALNPANSDHMTRWLLYSARRYTGCLSFVAEYLANCHAAGQPLPSDEINAFIHEQLAAQSAAAHTGEVACCFFGREKSLFKLTLVP